MVVGIDGSEGSRRALEWAVEHARRLGVSVMATYAWRGPSVPQLWYGPHSDPDDLARRAAQFLDAQLASVDTSGVDVERRVVDNRPSAALIEAGTLASLVVVGSRGHGQVTNVVLGSVSDQVAHHATCPVVVVP
jgi:nucleotide-binding universal stress UspA family protein